MELTKALRQRHIFQHLVAELQQNQHLAVENGTKTGIESPWLRHVADGSRDDRAPQPLFSSTTMPSLASTNLCGSMPNTSCHAPAAAHTSSYCSRSGSMNTRRWVS